MKAKICDLCGAISSDNSYSIDETHYSLGRIQWVQQLNRWGYKKLDLCAKCEKQLAACVKSLSETQRAKDEALLRKTLGPDHVEVKED